MPHDRVIHSTGLADQLSHTIDFDPADNFDRGVIFVSCSVVVGSPYNCGTNLAVSVNARARSRNNYSTTESTLTVTLDAGTYTTILSQNLQPLIHGEAYMDNYA